MIKFLVSALCILVPLMASAQSQFERPAETVAASEVLNLVPEIKSVRFDSEDGDAFAFQFYQRDSLGSFVRWYVSADPTPCVVKFLESELPLIFNLPDTSYVLRPENIYSQSPPTPWSVSVNGALIKNGENIAPTDLPNVAKLELTGAMSELLQYANGSVTLRQLPSTGSVVVEVRDNLKIQIDKRTPSDTIALGVAVKKWDVDSPVANFGVFGMTAKSQVDRLSPTVKFENAVPVVNNLPQIRLEELNNIELFRSRYVEGYNSLTSMVPQGIGPESIDARHQLKDRIAAVLIDGNFSVSLAWLNQFCELCREIRQYCSVHQDASGLPIDDQIVCWSRAERILGERMSFIVNYLIPNILEKVPLSIEDQIRVVDAYAELGDCQYVRKPDLNKFEHGELLYSILIAHLGRPWSPANTDLCLEFLVKMPAGSPAAKALTESLVLMNETERIPSIRMEQWYGYTVAFGTERDVKEILRQITLSKSGRSWLMDRLSEMNNDPFESKLLGCKFLLQRAESAKKLERWDFISKDEYSVIRDVCSEVKSRSDDIDE